VAEATLSLLRGEVGGDFTRAAAVCEPPVEALFCGDVGGVSGFSRGDVDLGAITVWTAAAVEVAAVLVSCAADLGINVGDNGAAGATTVGNFVLDGMLALATVLKMSSRLSEFVASATIHVIRNADISQTVRHFVVVALTVSH
jgi:hypothetical protein